ncbi:succinylglutamate desuccinylase/aspartoacylase family protein [Aliikangiella sp. G2MR2-5]|uniref:succinylglutamate desuccinylase/aspartoacylase domain-containing protein n=1 Tax=Aliikangiella sp. G2MR2-5 TaxID=2788943 RepID=UPI001FEE3D08|nr:succinylglutamate desuccinylase/aspartoacylase family protein [Aliikangiella sp. G2MR2-5]
MRLNSKITYYDDNFRSQIKETALEFLRQLDGLTIFDIRGEDQSRTRVVTTLIHGNEPSGLIACHLWLRSENTPATNLRIIICNPEAARSKPIFTNRYLSNSEDLNRFFNASDDDSRDVALRASMISAAIKEVSPEAILDLHNTSGVSPAFAVAVSEDDNVLDLVSLFTQKLILTGLKVGALMEMSFGAPIATIECGGASEIESHQVAFNGLNRFFMRKDIFDRHANQVQVHRHPIRIELVGDASVGFCHHRLPTTDITLRADVEQLNRQHTPAGEFLGWYNPKNELPLKAVDEQGKDQIRKIIEAKDGCLFARSGLQLFMVTTIPEIATNDCLFYATIE